MSRADSDSRTLARVKKDGRSVLRVRHVLRQMDERSDKEKEGLRQDLDAMKARITELERKTGG